MLILFDHGAPRSIARFLVGHTVTQAKAKGWDKLSNGKLLQAAEDAGFDVLLTTDKNIRYQQNLKGRRIAIVVLGNPQRPAVHRDIDRVVAAVSAATPGSYAEVDCPRRVSQIGSFSPLAQVCRDRLKLKRLGLV